MCMCVCQVVVGGGVSVCVCTFKCVWDGGVGVCVGGGGTSACVGREGDQCVCVGMEYIDQPPPKMHLAFTNLPPSLSLSLSLSLCACPCRERERAKGGGEVHKIRKDLWMKICMYIKEKEKKGQKKA